MEDDAEFVPETPRHIQFSREARDNFREELRINKELVAIHGQPLRDILESFEGFHKAPWFQPTPLEHLAEETRMEFPSYTMDDIMDEIENNPPPPLIEDVDPNDYIKTPPKLRRFNSHRPYIPLEPMKRKREETPSPVTMTDIPYGTVYNPIDLTK